MKGRKTTGLAALALAAAVLLLPPRTPTASGQPGRPEAIRIGLMQTLFRDITPSTVRMLMQPFNDLMRTQTGFEGQISQADSALALGQMLHEGKVHVGVF